jgi:DNA helicase IV
VPGEVIEYAARLLPVVAPGLQPPTSVRRARGELTIARVDPGELVARTVEVVRTTVGAVGSVGLVLPDAHVPATVEALTAAGLRHALLGDEVLAEFEVQLDVVPASLAKGLEFDHVVLVEPAGIVAGEPDHVTGLRRLYVCLTRAVTSLRVVHSRPLPEELGAPPA